MSIIAKAKSIQADNPTIGIIGGNGVLGSWFSRFLEGKGLNVLVSDRDTALTNQALVEKSNIIIFSVPISSTVEIINSLNVYVREDQMLADLTSLKSKPIAAMLESRAEVLGLHPMFGPPLADITGQTIIFCRSRPRKYTDFLLDIFSSSGAILNESTPEVHDQMMAVVQGLNHLSTIALGNAIQMMKVDIEESLKYSSPVYRMRLALAARLFAQSSELYADIAFENPQTRQVVEALAESTERIKSLILSNNRDGFIDLFNQASNHIDSFKEEGLLESSMLINYLSSFKSR